MSSSFNLSAFADDTAAMLPAGWTAHRIALPTARDQRLLTERVWDLGTLYYALMDFNQREAACLTGPDQTRLVMLPRPIFPGQVVVGSLRPDRVTDEVNDLPGIVTPMAITVAAHPARAAAAIHQRLLPAHAKALWRADMTAMRAGLATIDQADTAFDLVSDSLCDADGVPLDIDAYSQRKAVVRDVPAWDGACLFLDHYPHVLAGVNHHLAAGTALPQELHEHQWRVAALREAAAEGEAVRREWGTTAEFLRDHLPPEHPLHQAASEQAAMEGWGTAADLSSTGPAFLKVAEYLGPASFEQPLTPASRRAQAAVSRSATTAPASPAPEHGFTPPEPPQQPRPRR